MIVACISAYNEEQNIAKVLVKTRPYVDHIITCNDGSKDYTKEIAQELSDKIINHPTNLGYGRSLIDLFREALKLKADVIITLDADGQHDPDEIPKVVAPILNGEADIVVGSRFLSNKNEMKKYRRFGIRIINLLTQKASGGHIVDSQCGFRAYNQAALKKLRLTEHGMGLSAEILVKASEQGLKIAEVPVRVYYNDLNSSGQNPIFHGSNVVGAIIRRVVERQPFKYFALPALLSLTISIFFSIKALDLYASTGKLITNLALLAMFSFMFFIFLMNMAITLYALSRIRREIESR